jgi:hypothetical protein
MAPHGRRGGKCCLGICRRRDVTGPIFHTRKPPNGRIVAQAHFASRLPGDMAGQDICAAFYPDLRPAAQRNVM